MKTLKLLALTLIMALPFTSVEAGNKSESKITVNMSMCDQNNGFITTIENRENRPVTVTLTVKDEDGSVIITRKFDMEPLSSIEYRCEFAVDTTKKYTTDLKVEGNETMPKVTGTTLVNGFRYITGRY